MEGKRNKKKIIGIILALAIVALAAVIVKILFFSENKEAQEKEDAMNAAASTEQYEEQTEGSETFVIFGVDSRSGDLGKGTRSDSIMVANVDHETKEIKVASIYRDTYVDIDGHGLDKITHAHAYGGPVFAMDTVNRNFDLHIEKYITVNFGNVAEVIDDIGGIELDITSEEMRYINKYIDEINEVENTNSSHISNTGTQKVDGVQAVAYSRIRYTAGGDYKRAERQRTVLLKMFEAAKQQNTVKLLGIAKDMMDKIGTNYSSGEVIEILSYLAKYNMEETKGFPNKLWGGTIEGTWYAVPVTLESNAQALHNYLFNDEKYEPSDKVKEISEEIKKVASTPNEELE